MRETIWKYVVVSKRKNKIKPTIDAGIIIKRGFLEDSNFLSRRKFLHKIPKAKNPSQLRGLRYWLCIRLLKKLIPKVSNIRLAKVTSTQRTREILFRGINLKRANITTKMVI